MVQINTAFICLSLLTLPQLSKSMEISRLIDKAALNNSTTKDMLKKNLAAKDTLTRVSNRLNDLGFDKHNKHFNIPAKIYNKKYESDNLVVNSEPLPQNAKKKDEQSSNKIKSTFASSHSDSRTQTEASEINSNDIGAKESKIGMHTVSVPYTDGLDSQVMATGLGDLSLRKISSMFEGRLSSNIKTHNEEDFDVDDKSLARYIVEADDDDKYEDYSYEQYSDYAYKTRPVKYKIREILTKKPDSLDPSSSKNPISDNENAYDPFGDSSDDDDDEYDEFESSEVGLDYGFDAIEQELDKLADGGKKEDMILPDYGPAFPSSSNKVEVLTRAVAISLAISIVGSLI